MTGWCGGRALSVLASNRKAKGRADGELNVIAQHFDWLGGTGKGEDPDPRDRDKWKKDIARHLRELRKRIDQITGDRNKQPYEDKLKDLTDQLNHMK